MYIWIFCSICCKHDATNGASDRLLTFLAVSVCVCVQMQQHLLPFPWFIRCKCNRFIETSASWNETRRSRHLEQSQLYTWIWCNSLIWLPWHSVQPACWKKLTCGVIRSFNFLVISLYPDFASSITNVSIWIISSIPRLLGCGSILNFVGDVCYCIPDLTLVFTSQGYSARQMWQNRNLLVYHFNTWVLMDFPFQGLCRWHYYIWNCWTWPSPFPS